MTHNRPPLPVILLILLALAAAATYAFYPQLFRPTAEAESNLSASGTVETTLIQLSPETSGKVLEVFKEEGEAARAGEALFSLDSTLLDAQRNVAAANLATVKLAESTARAALASAQTAYANTLTSAIAEEQSLRLTDWNASKPADYDQPTWYFTRAEQASAARAEQTAAQDALTKAEQALKFIQEKATSQDFLQAEADLLAARATYQVAQDVLNRTNGATDGQNLRDAAQTAFDDAQANLGDAQTAYDDALTSEGADDVLTARAELRVAQERVDLARDRARAFETGANAPKVLAAQKAVEQAEAALAQTASAIQQAEASLALLDAQLARLTITAPVDGVILTRNIHPGEFVAPGAAALTLGKLDELTITVYIPEDRYGEIALGQSAEVTVDSFPGEVFRATVTRIADQAEFTPRNVQTVEGRKSTVYAIQLRLSDPGGKLKPGMPGDVVFK